MKYDVTIKETIVCEFGILVEAENEEEALTKAHEQAEATAYDRSMSGSVSDRTIILREHQ